MTDLDLTEAVEAAARARYMRFKGDGPERSWDEIGPRWRWVVEELVVAAAPLIERQVRDRIAADNIDRLCEIHHDAYETAAVQAGWQTQERSRKPWADVPEANKTTMRAAMRVLLDVIAYGGGS